MHGKQIKDATIDKGKLNLVNAVAANDPTTLSQVQTLLADAKALQNWKDPVRVAIFTNVTLSAPGGSIDGVAMALDESFLAGGQTTGSQNGVYLWKGAAVPAVRRTDFDASAEVISGMVVGVQEGTFADKYFKLTTNNPITLNTTTLTFQDFTPTSTSAVPTTSNKFMTALATVADFDAACNTGIASTPPNDGFVRVFINDVSPELGDGVRTKDCYFSGDAGATARTYANITSGDKLYWVGSVAGYQLAVTDKVSFDHAV